MQKPSKERVGYRTANKTTLKKTADKTTNTGKKKYNINKPKLIWTSVASVAALLLIVCVVVLFSTINDPAKALGVKDQTFFDPNYTPYNFEENPENLSDEELALLALKEKGIVNILLVGVDWNEEREKEAKNNPNKKQDMHSDAMIILAINFRENKADMISLPRDTFTYVPGVSGAYNGNGIYKLNAAINCGEKPYPEPESFEKLIESAEWMLGGNIPIDYYFCVDMPAVVGIVDAIGGITYDVDIDFYGGRNKANQEIRPYHKGVQDMNGQAVLDYLRTRKSSLTADGELGDLHRIDRQKEMLLSIFSQVKKKGNLINVLQILSAVNGRYHTNLDLFEIASLAKWANEIDEDKDIDMHSMEATMRYNLFLWNFCVTDQKKRVALIKQVYGVNVTEYKEYDVDYVTNYWNKVAGDQCRKNAKAFYDKYNVEPKEILQSPKPSESSTLSPSSSPNIGNSPEKNLSPSPTITKTPSPEPDENTGAEVGLRVQNNGYQLLSIAAPSPTPDGAKYDYSKCFTEKQRKEIAAVLNSNDVFKIKQVCERINDQFKKENKFTFPYPNWGPNLCKDNQIEVDFR